MSASLLIKKARGKLSQEGFARIVGTSKTSMQNWESGRKEPSDDSLLTIARIVPAMALEIERQIAERRLRPDRRKIRRRWLDMIDTIMHFAPDEIVTHIGDMIEERALRCSELRQSRARPRKARAPEAQGAAKQRR